jgi:GntR family transcriptional regulator
VTLEQRGATREEAAALGLDRGSAVVVVRRTRLADGRPVVAVEDVIAAERLAAVDLTADELVAALATEALYDVLDRLGLAVHHGIADIRPARSVGDVARRLDLKAGSLVVLIEQIDFTVDDEPVLFSRERHRPDVFQFRVYRRGPGSRR